MKKVYLFGIMATFIVLASTSLISAHHMNSYYGMGDTGRMYNEMGSFMGNDGSFRNMNSMYRYIGPASRMGGYGMMGSYSSKINGYRMGGSYNDMMGDYGRTSRGMY